MVVEWLCAADWNSDVSSAAMECTDVASSTAIFVKVWMSCRSKQARSMPT